MSLLGVLGAGLGLFGQAKRSEQSRFLTNKALKELKRKPPKLEIPLAYQQLLASLNDQAGQLGGAQKTSITESFGKSLAHALAQLQQRGLSSSNLIANLTAGSEKRKQEALAGVDQNILAQRLGLQQNIGVQGLQSVGAERLGQQGIRGQMIGNIANQYLAPQQGGDSNFPLMALKTFAQLQTGGAGGGGFG